MWIVCSCFTRRRRKTFLLREFDETLAAFKRHRRSHWRFVRFTSTAATRLTGIASLTRFLEANPAASSQSTAPVLVLGADHAGFAVKEAVAQQLRERGLQVNDLGTHTPEATDYPDYAQAVGRQVAAAAGQWGLLFCSTGVGMSIAANKIPGIRAALVFDTQTAAIARQHNNANVLCFAAARTTPAQVCEMVEAFLGAGFDGGRHERRIRKIEGGAVDLRLARVDAAIDEAIQHERRRQLDNIELIASENFTSPAVMEAQGSVLTNKYAEGYPRKRWWRLRTRGRDRAARH